MQVFLRNSGGLRAVQAQSDDTVASVSGVDALHAGGGATLRVVYGGRTLDPHTTLAAAGVPPCATLELLPRLRGGGGDGGATGAESRSSYLEMYKIKRPDRVDPEEERLARWTMCQLSGMPLQPPCCADELGSLFNKDVVLQALLTKSMPKFLAHISSLKHLVELRLGEAGAGGEPAPGDGTSAGSVRFACPITGQAFNGKTKFVIFRKSGHVISERALKEVPAVVEDLVGGKWEAADLLPVNPSGDELQTMRENLLLKRAAERAAKKEKKGKGKAAPVANGSNAEPAANGSGGVGSKRAAEGGGAAAAAPTNGGVAKAPSCTAAKKFKAAELKPQGADNEVWNSLFTSGQAPNGRGNNDYMTRGASRYVN